MLQILLKNGDPFHVVNIPRKKKRPDKGYHRQLLVMEEEDLGEAVESLLLVQIVDLESIGGGKIS